MSRLWGLVPLACWVVQVIRYRGEPANLLWMCHVAALLLAIGVLTRVAIVARIAAVWSIVGVPLWLIDVAANGAHPASILSHVAVLVVGFFALREHRGPALPVAAYAMTLFVLVQQLSRMSTAPELNINVAHAPYAVSMSYPAYWALTTLTLGGALALIAFASTRLPPLIKRRSREQDPRARPRASPQRSSHRRAPIPGSICRRRCRRLNGVPPSPQARRNRSRSRSPSRRCQSPPSP